MFPATSGVHLWLLVVGWWARLLLPHSPVPTTVRSPRLIRTDPIAYTPGGTTIGAETGPIGVAGLLQVCDIRSGA